MRCVFISVLISILLVACNFQRTLSSEELKSFVLNPDNGLRKTIESNNGVQLEMLYRPKDLVLAQEADDDIEAWREAENRLDSLDYFVLRISKDNQEIENGYAGDPVRFNAVIQYLSEAIKEDVSMVANTSFVPESSLFAQSFGSSTSTSVMLVFKSYLTRQDGAFTVVFDDPVFGSGRSEFQFDCKNIKNTPRLKF